MQDYTIETGFLPHLECASIEEAVGALVKPLALAGDVEESSALVAEVMRREAEGSTAIGDGLVIPHARFKGVHGVRLAVATLARPLAVPSADDRPVDVIILLVGPTGDPRRMLQVLARLARLVKSPAFLDGLRAAATREDLRKAFGGV
jgi:mannitol/fructose-specific phosphotransferase system IIA component (Ntr-type)